MATVHSAKEIIDALKLAPHPEKGYYIETFRDTPTGSDQRSQSTCIYYLLEGDSGLSHWHRVLDAIEVWHYYAGAPLRLSLSWDDGKPVRDVVLGSDLWNVSWLHFFSLQSPYTLTLGGAVGSEASSCYRTGGVAARKEPG